MNRPVKKEYTVLCMLNLCLCIFFLFITQGCGSNDQKEIKLKYGHIRITAPKDWKVAFPHPQKSPNTFVEIRKNNSFIAFMLDRRSRKKSDGPNLKEITLDLPGIHKNTIAEIKKMKKGVFVKPDRELCIDGVKALQSEIKELRDEKGKKMEGLITSIAPKSKRYFIRVIAGYDTNKKEVSKIIKNMKIKDLDKAYQLDLINIGPRRDIFIDPNNFPKTHPW